MLNSKICFVIKIRHVLLSENYPKFCYDIENPYYIIICTYDINVTVHNVLT